MMTVPADTARNTRTRILDVFSSHLATQGYGGVSLDAVAREVGIRKPSLYHHFPDGKESVYREAALAYIARAAARVASAIDAADTLDARLIELALLHTEPSPAGPDLDQQVYDATRHVSDETRTVVSTAYLGETIAPVVRLMRGAVDAGELTGDPDFLAWSFLHLAQGIVPLPDDIAMPPAERGAGPEVRAKAGAVVRLFLDGARAREGR